MMSKITYISITGISAVEMFVVKIIVIHVQCATYAILNAYIWKNIIIYHSICVFENVFLSCSDDWRRLDLDVLEFDGE